MDFQTLTSQQVATYCTIIPAHNKHEFILSLSYKALLELQPDITSFSHLEIKCDLKKGLEFSPVQRNSIKVTTSYLTLSSFFTYFIRIVDYNELNQITGSEDTLNGLTVSYRCLKN